MIVSFDEAFSLLRKWKSESVGVRGMLQSNGVAVEFGGLIKDLGPDGLVITQYARPNEKVGEVKIGLRSATAFEWGDLREMPQDMRDLHVGKIESIMVLHLPAATCMLIVGGSS